MHMVKEVSEKVLLITNDDGIEAKGLRELVDAVRSYGRVVVVAPAEPQSAMSHAITVKVPLRIRKVMEEDSVIMYKCYGTPVDCVKMAFNHVLTSKPDLLLSGINHGSNSATSVFYSGTMGAALEGCINEVPSIGFSLLNLDHDADFSASKHYISKITGMVLKNGLPRDVCLNVNIPDVDIDSIRGIRVCRQNKGYWREEYEKRTDPQGRNYFWLTGTFHNSEPDATDTDEWALSQNFVSVVPLHIDMTCYKTLSALESWNFDSLSVNTVNQ
jgi:5'-nucleotidase